jgi:hypothetical protein
VPRQLARRLTGRRGEEAHALRRLDEQRAAVAIDVAQRHRVRSARDAPLFAVARQFIYRTDDGQGVAGAVPVRVFDGRGAPTGRKLPANCASSGMAMSPFGEIDSTRAVRMPRARVSGRASAAVMISDASSANA